jgi:hypothetical protein
MSAGALGSLKTLKGAGYGGYDVLKFTPKRAETWGWASPMHPAASIHLPPVEEVARLTRVP